MRSVLFECALALAIVALIAPGVIWWLGTFIALFTGERPW
jgi:hypothetical protein